MRETDKQVEGRGGLQVEEEMNVDGRGTRFGEISPLWHDVKSLWLYCKGSFNIWLLFAF